MLRLLTDLFESLKAPAPEKGAGNRHTLELATAVLLIEVMRADGRLDDVERESVLGALRGKFTLSEAELADLFDLAHRQSENAHDLHSYTDLLNRSLDEPQRIRVFELLWQVAYSDGHADAHESHLLRKLADLLHIRHGDAIGAKLRAEAAKPSR